MKDNKQNKPTFADRARALQNKYKKAAWDKLEADELEAEMEKLQAEQEQMRQLMGLNEQPQQQVQQFPWGGFTPYGVNNIAPQKLPEDAYLTPEQLAGMGSPYLKSNKLSSTPQQEFLSSYPNSPKPVVNTTPSKINTKNNIIKQDLVQGTLLSPEQASVGIETDIRNSNTFSPESLNFHSKQLLNTGLEFDKLKTFASGQQAKADDMNKPGFWDKNKQYLPYAISGASNIASNLLLAAMAKKNQTKINPVLANPTQINMEPQAEQMRKDAGVSKNIGMKQARDLGLNAGATLANMGAIGSGVDRQLGSNLTNLYGQQEQYNVGAANQFALQNQDAVNRANLINSQYQAQTLQNRLGLYDDITKTLPGVLKDIRMDKADKEMRDALNSQAKNSGGKNYYAVGDLFSKEGLTYRVKEVDTNGNPTKTELVKDKSTTDKKYQELLLAPKITFQKQKFNTNRN